MAWYLVKPRDFTFTLYCIASNGRIMRVLWTGNVVNCFRVRSTIREFYWTIEENSENHSPSRYFFGPRFQSKVSQIRSRNADAFKRDVGNSSVKRKYQDPHIHSTTRDRQVSPVVEAVDSS